MPFLPNAFNNVFRVRILSVSAILAAVSLVSACSTPQPLNKEYLLMEPSTKLSAPNAVISPKHGFSEAQVNQGKYMVGLLGCSTCHTDGALIGQPNFNRLMAGSRAPISLE